MHFRTTTGFPAPGLTVDAALVKLGPAPAGEVLLVRRGREPFLGKWALPGGFVDVGERTRDAALRELVEETGMLGEVVDLLGVYDEPGRDPRAHIVTVCYVCAVRGVAPGLGGPMGMDDAAEAAWWPLDAPPELAADHADILADLRRWLAEGGREKMLAAADA